MAKPKSIDEYLANVGGAQHAALVKLRKAVRSILPDAVECISYSMPAFRYQGRVVAGFLATKRGCSYFPFSGRTLATLASELTAYEQTKSALHFDPKHPLPKGLVGKLLRARIGETTSKATASTPARPKPKRRT
jgi:uncharacterized protein YdhG (YjbR/CyaY superfamily)